MRRLLVLAFVSGIVLLFAAGGVSAQELTPPVVLEAETSPAEQGGVCVAFPGVAETLCDGVGSVLGWGIQPVVSGGAQAVLLEMVSFVVEGAGWLLEQVAAFLDTSTRPQLTSSWFERAYGDMAVVAVFGLLPFVLLAIIQGLVRQDLGLLLRATFGYVPLAAVGTAAGVVVVDLLVQLTDLLTAWVGRSLGSDLAAFSTRMGESLASLPAGTGGPVAGLAALLAAGVVAFAAFAIWLELLLRQAAIYVAVLFLPLGFMAMVWPATAHWLRRLIQGLVAIILSKFVIVAVMALAAAALGGETDMDPTETGGFGIVLAGASMLALAALAPYVLLRLIPVFEAGLSGDLEGTFRRPTAAVASPTAGHHALQAVRHHGATGGGLAYASAAPGAAGTPGAADGGASATPDATPTAGTAASAGGSSAAGPGPAGAGSPTAGAGAGATGAAAGAGVVAVPAATVAAGAGGAKRVGERLQRQGAEQQTAASADRPTGTSPPAPGRPPSSRAPTPTDGPKPPPRQPTSGGARPKAPERPTREGS
jgi:hypothetical protein